MTRQPVTTLHILCCPREQQLAEAQHRDKYIGLMDDAVGEVHPFQRLARIVALDPLASGKLSRRDACAPEFRKLAVELLPKIRVAGQVLGLFLPQKLQWVTERQIMNDQWPIQLAHP